jgi:cyclopropane fatty-acyl-phospholipid synthase-like methyltransferase
MAQDGHGHGFLPALGHDLLTPLYDTLIGLTMNERAVKQQLVAQARIAPGMTVVDFGCGTGTLVLMIAQTHPAARVVGLDVDEKILAIARAKIGAAAAVVELRQGLVQEVGLAPGSVDRVLTSLVLHHLATEEKRSALRALHAALKPGGELHVLDFGPPHNALMSLLSKPLRLFDGRARTDDNFTGRLPAIIADAGFRDVTERGHRMSPFGTLAYWSAVA